MPVDTKKIIAALDKVCNAVIANEQLLSELDRKTGDGDHGANMKRGCSAIKQMIPEFGSLDLAGIINKCAMTLLAKVGGASGPLLASGLMKIAKDLLAQADFSNLDHRDQFLQSVKSFTQGIKERGKAELGDKTFIDFLQPFCKAFAFQYAADRQASLKQLVDASITAGEAGLAHTSEIPAKKGRASYLGERSIGIRDPGATTMSIVFNAIRGVI